MKAKILTIILLFLLVASNASALIAANFIDKNNNQVGVLIVEKGETAVFETTLYSALGKGHENINILLVDIKGNVIKTMVNSISILGRATQGVRVMRLDEGDSLAAAAKIMVEDNDEASQVEPSEPILP